MKRILFLSASVGILSNIANAQTAIQQPAAGPTTISLTAVNVAYLQNFPRVDDGSTDEGLNASGSGYSHLPIGWAFSERTNNATDADGLYSTSSGGSATSATGRSVYSFGTTSANTDRALGAITGGGVANPHNIKIGTKFTNNTEEVVTSLLIKYTGEQWRRFITASAGSGSPDANPGNYAKSKLSFSYRIANGTLNDGTWTAVPSLDFEGPITNTNGAFDGNDAENRIEKNFTITGLNIPDGATFWIRWEKDSGVDGVVNNDALAIDDFSLTPNPAPLPVNLTSFNYQQVGSAIKLNWETSSERKNDYFDLLRSTDGVTFQSLTHIQGNGTSNTVNKYSYTDFNPLAGTSYYQLKQVDFNGDIKTYPAIAVKSLEQEFDFNITSSSENKVSLKIYSPVKTTSTLQFVDINGRQLLNKNISLESGYNDVNFHLQGMNEGVYVAILSADGKIIRKKFLGK